MLLTEYMAKLNYTLKEYNIRHNVESYNSPLAITEDFNQYRYAMILVLKEYIDRYVNMDETIDAINDDTLEIEWKDNHWDHNDKFDYVRQEFVRVILDILSDDESVFLPSLAWSNHLEHTGGYLLKDHGKWIGLKPSDIDTISQSSLVEVFPDTFD